MATDKDYGIVFRPFVRNWCEKLIYVFGRKIVGQVLRVGTLKLNVNDTKN